MTLTEFLLARIAEDEVRMRAWGDAETPRLVDGVDQIARVLSECKAKRRMVYDYERYDRSGAAEVDGARRGLSMAIRELATVYADHPDYRDEWLP